ncbi:MAG: hypothetical protein ACYS5F_15005 [Planctomycetota bacterium]|jgi:hypothetical protein
MIRKINTYKVGDAVLVFDVMGVDVAGEVTKVIDGNRYPSHRDCYSVRFPPGSPVAGISSVHASEMSPLGGGDV